jgi:hypothetical protein
MWFNAVSLKRFKGWTMSGGFGNCVGLALFFVALSCVARGQTTEENATIRGGCDAGACDEHNRAHARAGGGDRSDSV